MNQQKLLSNLENILTKILAGAEAMNEDEKNSCFSDINQLIPALLKSSILKDNPETLFLLEQILRLPRTNGLAEGLTGALDKEAFFELGTYLLNSLNPKKKEIRRLIFSWLDLLRQPPFLIRIYDEKRWPELTAKLVRESNLNFAELFKMRVLEYEDKTLFKIFEGIVTKEFSWKQTAARINRFAKGLAAAAMEGRSEPHKIAFLLENSIDMACLDLACLTHGIVNIMIPANSVPSQIEFIIKQSKAGIILLNDDKQLAMPFSASAV